MKICVVDVARVFAQSKPAEEARKHLAEVQSTLKKGLDDVASAYTPVPGGVGPMTINTLIYQSLESGEKYLG